MPERCDWCGAPLDGDGISAGRGVWIRAECDEAEGEYSAADAAYDMSKED